MNRLKGISLLYLLTLCYIKVSSGVHIDINALDGKGLKILKYTKNNVHKTIIYSTENLPITGVLDNGNLVWLDYIRENCGRVTITRFAHSTDVLIEVFLLSPMFSKTKIYLKHKGEYSRINKQTFKHKMKILSEMEKYGPEKIFNPQVEKPSTSEETRKRKKPTLETETKTKAKKRKKTPTETKAGQTSEHSEVTISLPSSHSESESDNLSSKIDETSSKSSSKSIKSSSKSSEFSFKTAEPSHKVVLEDDSESNLSEESELLLSDVPSGLSFDRSVTPVETPIQGSPEPVFEVSDDDLGPEVLPIELSSDSVDKSKSTKTQSGVKKPKASSVKKNAKGTKNDSKKTRVRSVQTDSKNTEDAETQTDAKIDTHMGKLDEKEEELFGQRTTDSIKADDGSQGVVTPLEKRKLQTDLYHQDPNLEFEVRKKLKKLKKSQYPEKEGDTKLLSKYVLDIKDPKRNPRITYHYEINDGIVAQVIKVKGGKVINNIVEGNLLIHKSTRGKLLCLTIFSLFGKMKLMEIIMEEENGNYVIHYKKGAIFWVESYTSSFEQSYLELKKEINYIADVTLDISIEIDESFIYCRSIEKNGVYQLIYYPKTGFHMKRIKCATSLVWSSDTRRCLSAALTMDKYDIIRLIRLELLDPTDGNVSELYFFLSNDLFTLISESLYDEIMESELITSCQIYDSDDSDYPSPIEQPMPTKQFIAEPPTQQDTQPDVQESESESVVLVPETVHVEIESEDEEEIDPVKVLEDDITKFTETEDVSGGLHKKESVKIMPIKPIPIKPIPHLPPIIPPITTIAPHTQTIPPPTITPIASTVIHHSDIFSTKETGKDKKKSKKDKKRKKPKIKGAKQTSGDVGIPSGIKDITKKDVDAIDTTESSSVEDAVEVSSETASVDSEDDNEGFTEKKIKLPRALIELNISESKTFTEETHVGIKCKTFYPKERYGFKCILHEKSQIWAGGYFEYSNFVRVYLPKGGPMLGVLRAIKRKPFQINRYYFVELYNGKWKIIDEAGFKTVIELYINSDSEDDEDTEDDESNENDNNDN